MPYILIYRRYVVHWLSRRLYKYTVQYVLDFKLLWQNSEHFLFHIRLKPCISCVCRRQNHVCAFTQMCKLTVW